MCSFEFRIWGVSEFIRFIYRHLLAFLTNSVITQIMPTATHGLFRHNSTLMIICKSPIRLTSEPNKSSRAFLT
jgi:hypothetical protein